VINAGEEGTFVGFPPLLFELEAVAGLGDAEALMELELSAACFT
jgi:hypothetical protein